MGRPQASRIPTHSKFVRVPSSRRQNTPELCLINSHDRSSAYQLHAGLYRFICANGMFVGDGNAFERVSIRHAGFTPDEESTRASASSTRFPPSPPAWNHFALVG